MKIYNYMDEAEKFFSGEVKSVDMFCEYIFARTYPPLKFKSQYFSKKEILEDYLSLICLFRLNDRKSLGVKIKLFCNNYMPPVDQVGSLDVFHFREALYLLEIISCYFAGEDLKNILRAYNLHVEMVFQLQNKIRILSGEMPFSNTIDMYDNNNYDQDIDAIIERFSMDPIRELLIDIDAVRHDYEIEYRKVLNVNRA